MGMRMREYWGALHIDDTSNEKNRLVCWDGATALDFTPLVAQRAFNREPRRLDGSTGPVR